MRCITALISFIVQASDSLHVFTTISRVLTVKLNITYWYNVVNEINNFMSVLGGCPISLCFRMLNPLHINQYGCLSMRSGQNVWSSTYYPLSMVELYSRTLELACMFERAWYSMHVPEHVNQHTWIRAWSCMSVSEQVTHHAWLMHGPECKFQITWTCMHVWAGMYSMHVPEYMIQHAMLSAHGKACMVLSNNQHT
jgi:hypothetical protein